MITDIQFCRYYLRICVSLHIAEIWHVDKRNSVLHPLRFGWEKNFPEFVSIKRDFHPDAIGYLLAREASWAARQNHG